MKAAKETDAPKVGQCLPRRGRAEGCRDIGNLISRILSSPLRQHALFFAGANDHQRSSISVRLNAVCFHTSTFARGQDSRRDMSFSTQQRVKKSPAKDAGKVRARELAVDKDRACCWQSCHYRPELEVVVESKSWSRRPQEVESVMPEGTTPTTTTTTALDLAVEKDRERCGN